jgi:hypothetical protein
MGTDASRRLRGELHGLPREGFGVPASPFMWALLHYYKVELHHLTPNSILQAAIFAVVCEGYLGMEPPLQGGALRQEGGRARGAACSARGELHPPSPVRLRRPIHPSVVDFFKQRLA